MDTEEEWAGIVDTSCRPVEEKENEKEREQQQQQQQQSVFVEEHDPIPMQCNVCSEDLHCAFAEEEDRWFYKESVRLVDRVVHRACFEAVTD